MRAAAPNPDCEGGRCKPPECGDGVVDPGEECDDGNLVSGDGCELDCTFSCHHDEECLDEDLCTVGERCVEVSSGRRCQAGARAQCPPEDANPCMTYVCDPNAPESGYCAATPLVLCYPDEDGDGFPLFDESRSVESEGSLCDCPVIDGVTYLRPRSDGLWDCDDTNERHYPGAVVCFKDEDGDGYPLIDDFDRMREDCSCFDPYIHRRSDGVWDCDDASERLYPGARCLFDRDEDGFPSDEEASPLSAFCECPEEAIIEREDGLADCDDAAPTIYPHAPCYIDADEDGSQAPDPVGDMGNSCECAGASAPRDLGLPTDCDDSNPNVHPGQLTYYATGYCPGLGPDGSCEAAERSFDYNCDGEETKDPLCVDSPPFYCCDQSSGTGSCAGNGFEWLEPPPACGTLGRASQCTSDCGFSTFDWRVSCR